MLQREWLDLLDGFQLSLRARGLSPETQRDYARGLSYLSEYLETHPCSPPGSAATWRSYLAWLRKRPHAQHPERAIGPKTVVNAYITLRALGRWWHEELGLANTTAEVQRPKAPEPLIVPLTREQVVALLAACDKRRYNTHGREYEARRPTATRDRAIVTVLLDTGLRASELCALTIADYIKEEGKLIVRCGKGGRGRQVYLGAAAQRALWRSLMRRPERRPDEPLFVTSEGRPFDRQLLRQLIARLGEHAGIPHLHPHTLRHTFATEFLRNGGNLLSLQRLLGHRSLEMVKRYASIAEADLRVAQQSASPADRWRL